MDTENELLTITTIPRYNFFAGKKMSLEQTSSAKEMERDETILTEKKKDKNSSLSFLRHYIDCKSKYTTLQHIYRDIRKRIEGVKWSQMEYESYNTNDNEEEIYEKKGPHYSTGRKKSKIRKMMENVLTKMNFININKANNVKIESEGSFSVPKNKSYPPSQSKTSSEGSGNMKIVLENEHKNSSLRREYTSPFSPTMSK